MKTILSVLKGTQFLPNSCQQMYRKALENTEDRAGIDLAPFFGSKLQLVLCAGLMAISGTEVFAQSRSDSTDVAKYAMKLPENALLRIDPKIVRPSISNRLPESGLTDGAGSALSGRNSLATGLGEYAWKQAIATTIFWVGEQASPGNPVANDKSAWDISWISSYGGTDSPNSEDRQNFLPASFIPRQNPFYVALPYNDIDDHHTKPEAAQVIPWFKSSFVRDGQSVCKGRWVAIRHGNKVCYAQWEDVGPFQTDHWQYVFGNERPRPNRNQDAGLDVSPAVRQYLGLGNIDFCDWKFVDFFHVPIGPWAIYGENNTFSRYRRPNAPSVAVSRHSAPPF
jgi:hypothetical protein